MRTCVIQSDFDETLLALAIRQAENPRAIVQIAHGMAEHKARYYPFMDYLAARGIESWIIDHRGHGESARREDLGYLAKGGADGVVADMAQLTGKIREAHPGRPIILLGHSMGALAARAYIQAHGAFLKGLILSGNPGLSPAAGLGLRMARWAQLRNPRAMCRPLNHGMYIPFRRRFPSRTTQNNWLCADPQVVGAYDADPLCGFAFTANGYEALLTLMARAYDTKQLAPNQNLPIALFSGAEDPVTGGARGLLRAIEVLTGAGYKSVEQKAYPGMRHEILNERGKEEVWRDMAEKIEAWAR